MPLIINKFKDTDKYASYWTIMALDLVISVIASVFSVMAVRFFNDPFGSFRFFLTVWGTASALTTLVALALSGTSYIVIRHSSFRSIGKFMLATTLKEAMLAGLIFTGGLKYFGLDRFQIECEVLLVDALLTLFLFIVTRVVIIAAFQNADNDDVESNVKRLGVLVFGTSNKAVAMVTRLSSSPNYDILGFITFDQDHASKVIQDRSVFAVETSDDLAALKSRLGVQCILFADESLARQEKDRLIPMCLDLGLHILNSPRIDDVTFGAMSQHAIQEVSAKQDDYIPDGMGTIERETKRVVDCILAGLLLVVFSPLFLIVYIAIKMEDHGPAIYRQERLGRFGRPFHILKFRSMRTDAEAAGPALYAGDEDPRLTKVGKFIRQHHLDELPQLWNVFVGDMSFVGYRPERKFYIDKIMEVDPRYYYLYQIRPGVTSYATLNNGYTDTMEKMLRRLEFDLYYLRHRSWWFDIKILWMTFANIVFGKKF
ncbi:MAG: exopolysaccharide biosynthesis polyprenyl glycosylphosphotransferase [Bacteroidales bacterium]|nr:exopolysaccharide biosynthesis polyprenyl glycosylphosphotransferase [Candidatus Cryptobacteroides faecihippi]